MNLPDLRPKGELYAGTFLKLESAYLEFPQEWTHRREGLSFLFPQAGGGTYLSGPVAQPLSPGDVLVLNGAEAGKVRPSSGGALAFRGFSLCIEHLFPLFATNEVSVLKHVAEAFKGMRFYPATTPLAAKCHRRIGEMPLQLDLGHRSQLLGIASVILTPEFETARAKQGRSVSVEDHIIRRFNAFSAKDSSTLSVEELAEQVGCSPRHLCRLFHRYYGL